jgi:hypothetical protein
VPDAPRRPGRPPIDPNDPSVKVSISLPSRQYDAFCERARREGVGVPAIIRRELEKNPKK